MTDNGRPITLIVTSEKSLIARENCELNSARVADFTPGMVVFELEAVDLADGSRRSLCVIEPSGDEAEPARGWVTSLKKDGTFNLTPYRAPPSLPPPPDSKETTKKTAAKKLATPMHESPAAVRSRPVEDVKTALRGGSPRSTSSKTSSPKALAASPGTSLKSSKTGSPKMASPRGSPTTAATNAPIHVVSKDAKDPAKTAGGWQDRAAKPGAKAGQPEFSLPEPFVGAPPKPSHRAGSGPPSRRASKEETPPEADAKLKDEAKDKAKEETAASASPSTAATAASSGNAFDSLSAFKTNYFVVTSDKPLIARVECALSSEKASIDLREGRVVEVIEATTMDDGSVRVWTAVAQGQRGWVTAVTKDGRNNLVPADADEVAAAEAAASELGAKLEAAKKANEWKESVAAKRAADEAMAKQRIAEARKFVATAEKTPADKKDRGPAAKRALGSAKSTALASENGEGAVAEPTETEAEAGRGESLGLIGLWAERDEEGGGSFKKREAKLEDEGALLRKKEAAKEKQGKESKDKQGVAKEFGMTSAWKEMLKTRQVTAPAPAAAAAAPAAVAPAPAAAAPAPAAGAPAPAAAASDASTKPRLQLLSHRATKLTHAVPSLAAKSPRAASKPTPNGSAAVKPKHMKLTVPLVKERDLSLASHRGVEAK